MEADISQNAVFSCEAFGSPLPQLLWARLGPDDQLQFLDDVQSEGRANESSISISITNDTAAGSVASELEIQNVQLSDQGTYLCLTSNDVVIGNLTTVENASAELLLEGEWYLLLWNQQRQAQLVIEYRHGRKAIGIKLLYQQLIAIANRIYSITITLSKFQKREI